MIPLYLQTEFEKLNSLKLYSKKDRHLRKKAFSEFLEKGLPSNKSEEWRYTNLSKINKGVFRIPETGDGSEKNVNTYNYPLKSLHTIVIYNGFFRKDLSTIPHGINLDSNIDFTEGNSNAKQPERSSFGLLNTAFMHTSLYLKVKEETVIDEPLRILFICSGKEKLMVHPRVQIDLGNFSSLNVIEHHVGSCDEYFYNESIVLKVGRYAKFDHIRIQNNSKKTINFCNLHIQQKSNSDYSFTQFALGSALSRINLYADLIGHRANCALNGLSMSNNDQHLDAFIVTNHHAPNCTSSQNFKYILKDKSSGVFNGRSIVQNSAEKTSSSQSNKNLLLSKQSLMNSNPQLEIYTDDVKCSHGSSTGALESDALFYIRSRGIDQTSAISLLVGGFASEIIEIIKISSVKNYINDYFDQWISKNDQ